MSNVEVTKIWPVDSRQSQVNVDLIVKALCYYAKNHPKKRPQVKKELENWEKEESD